MYISGQEQNLSLITSNLKGLKHVKKRHPPPWTVMHRSLRVEQRQQMILHEKFFVFLLAVKNLSFYTGILDTLEKEPVLYCHSVGLSTPLLWVAFPAYWQQTESMMIILGQNLQLLFTRIVLLKWMGFSHKFGVKEQVQLILSMPKVKNSSNEF